VSENEIVELVTNVFVRIVPEAKEVDIDPAVAFRDQFDIDSLDYLNFVLALVKETGIEVPDADFPKLATVNGCARYLMARQPADPR
jgi:acyl carrier protein